MFEIEGQVWMIKLYFTKKRFKEKLKKNLILLLDGATILFVIYFNFGIFSFSFFMRSRSFMISNFFFMLRSIIYGIL